MTTIARVRFTWGGKPLEATLADGGEWSCPDAAIEDVLNLKALAADPSPADGAPYHRHAREVAALLGGEVEFPPREPGPPGRVY